MYIWVSIFNALPDSLSLKEKKTTTSLYCCNCASSNHDCFLKNVIYCDWLSTGRKITQGIDMIGKAYTCVTDKRLHSDCSRLKFSSLVFSIHTHTHKREKTWLGSLSISLRDVFISILTLTPIWQPHQLQGWHQPQTSVSVSWRHSSKNSAVIQPSHDKSLRLGQITNNDFTGLDF